MQATLSSFSLKSLSILFALNPDTKLTPCILIDLTKALICLTKFGEDVHLQALDTEVRMFTSSPQIAVIS